tara:strand:- start:346 stop:597 length:252 start_codon:yes stop_codon:yes gene_type:complete
VQTKSKQLKVVDRPKIGHKMKCISSKTLFSQKMLYFKIPIVKFKIRKITTKNESFIFKEGQRKTNIHQTFDLVDPKEFLSMKT